MNGRPSIGGTGISKGALLWIVMIGCWVVVLAIVLNSVFASSKLNKQIRSKDRQSTQGR
jgi:uncharacterized membrane protein